MRFSATCLPERPGFYTVSLLERTTTKSLPILDKAVDFAPAAQACCGVCRTCMSTNIMSAIAAGTVFVAAPVVRFAKRLRRSPVSH